METEMTNKKDLEQIKKIVEEMKDLVVELADTLTIPNDPVEALHKAVQEAPNGEYFISNELFTTLNGLQFRALSWGLNEIVFTNPAYIWKSEIIDGPDRKGLLITWRLR